MLYCHRQPDEGPFIRYLHKCSMGLETSEAEAVTNSSAYRLKLVLEVAFQSEGSLPSLKI